MSTNKMRFPWAIAIFMTVILPLGVLAATLPSGEHAVGNTVIEPAYDDTTGSIVYLHTPNKLAPLGSHPFGGNQHAAASWSTRTEPT